MMNFNYYEKNNNFTNYYSNPIPAGCIPMKEIDFGKYDAIIPDTCVLVKDASFNLVRFLTTNTVSVKFAHTVLCELDRISKRTVPEAKFANGILKWLARTPFAEYKVIKSASANGEADDSIVNAAKCTAGNNLKTLIISNDKGLISRILEIRGPVEVMQLVNNGTSEVFLRPVRKAPVQVKKELNRLAEYGISFD